MLRGKYGSGNLRRENEKKIARYLERFVFQPPDPAGPHEGNRGKDEGLAEETAAVTSRPKEAKSRVKDNAVAIKLASIERPGTSKAPPRNKPPVKFEQSKGKSTADKATQIMRQNLSSQTLRENDINDDDGSSTEDAQRRPKYVLVGWDSFRTKLMIVLMILLIVWAAIYFPLIGT